MSPVDSASGFEWDLGDLAKCQSHGVPLKEIEALFTDGTLVVFPDPSTVEPRLRGIGQSASGRSIFVVYTLRNYPDRTLIRPISARYMHAKEVEYYAKENAAGFRL